MTEVVASDHDIKAWGFRLAVSIAYEGFCLPEMPFFAHMIECPGLRNGTARCSWMTGSSCCSLLNAVCIGPQSGSPNLGMQMYAIINGNVNFSIIYIYIYYIDTFTFKLVHFSIPCFSVFLSSLLRSVDFIRKLLGLTPHVFMSCFLSVRSFH